MLYRIHIVAKRCVVSRLLLVLSPFLLASHSALAGVMVVPTPVPEPITLSLLAVGVGGTLLYRRFRK